METWFWTHGHGTVDTKSSVLCPLPGHAEYDSPQEVSFWLGAVDSNTRSGTQIKGTNDRGPET